MTIPDLEIRLLALEILQILVDRQNFADKISKIGFGLIQFTKKFYILHYILELFKIFLNLIYPLKQNEVIFQTLHL